MRLIEDFAVCLPETQQRSSAMRSEIHSLGEAEQGGLEEEAKEKAADDARIQRNALKMQDPERAKDLTRKEREEVYKRSLKEMGLNEGWSDDAGTEGSDPENVPNHGFGRTWHGDHQTKP